MSGVSPTGLHLPLKVLQHVQMRSAIRTIATAIGGAFALPVLYLNVETVAIEHGWGSVLSNLLKGNASWVLAFALHHWTIAATLCTVAFLIGLWLDTWAKTFDASRPNKQQIVHGERQDQSKRLLRLAKKAELAAQYSSTSTNEIPQILSEIFIAMTDLEDQGFNVPELGEQTKGLDKLRIAARYFRVIIPFIAAGRMDEAKNLSP
jgi:hypothetical protein